MPKLIQDFYQTKPILGVCLGHQAIAETLGGTLRLAKRVMHGRQSTIETQGPASLFSLPATRDHRHALPFYRCGSVTKRF